MSRVTQEEILAVHEELAALVRAGLPIATHLWVVADQLPLSLRSRAQDLAERLERGEAIEAALQATQLAMNADYQALFGVAMRAPHPAEALENSIRSARRATEMRSHLAAEMIYPCMIALVAMGTVSFSLLKTVPVFSTMATKFNSITPSMAFLSTFSKSLESSNHLWLHFAMVLGTVVVGYLVYASGVSSLNPLYIVWPFHKMRAASAQATFYESLAMLLANNMTLEKALMLAAQSTLWPPLRLAALKLSDQVTLGKQFHVAADPISPYVMWILANVKGPQIALELHREAMRLNREVERQRHWFCTYLPVIVTAVVGSTTVLFMAFLNYWPLVTMMQYLASPLSQE